MRDHILDALRREVIGPDEKEPYLDYDSGQEIIVQGVHGEPWNRYGAGMLYPQKNKESEAKDDPEDIISPGSQSSSTDRQDLEGGTDDRITEEPVALANQYKPSAMGFTITLDSTDPATEISITIKSAIYVRYGDFNLKQINYNDGTFENIPGRLGNGVPSRCWIRRPVEESICVYIDDLKNEGVTYERSVLNTDDLQPWLKLQIYNRSTEEDYCKNQFTLTFTLINCCSTADDTQDNEVILYQNELSVNSLSECIKPYRERESKNDQEGENELRLLYRKKRIYAIGHGCSVNWDTQFDKSPEWVATSFLPEYEIPPVVPTQHVELKMFELSDYGNWDTAKESLQSLATFYGNWIDDLKGQVKDIPEYAEAARINIEKCKISQQRIGKGISMLIEQEADSNLVKCFQWMNRAMLWQQQRSKTKQRKWLRKGNDFTLETIDGFEKHGSPEEFHNSSTPDIPRGRWRPFQLAFILMNIESIWNENSTERDIVDLIWFPTGGGKTEAYLGLAALTLFARRFRKSGLHRHKNYAGTAIIMRYTLRLLTAQQYERAASLICACELIRLEGQNSSLLGPDPISIGLWAGYDVTPTKRTDAVENFNNLNNGTNEDYKFVVMKCPCCGAQIGKVNAPSNTPQLKGLVRENGRVLFQCENKFCEFYQIELPLYVVDQDIYEFAPSLLLGTVDKFAQITWKKEAGRIFGFRWEENGENKTVTRINPPELIIQDELHLISGPLGTMVGLYETMIQTLCINYKRGVAPFYPVGEQAYERPPKIVASSATISRASEQVKALYNSEVSIFPAQGLTFGDTWFSEEKKTDEKPGRRYVGILAPGYQSGQTTVVRTYTPVLQSIKSFEVTDTEKNYYWTLIGFFNSIRELGLVSSLLSADIVERLSIYQERNFLSSIEKRNLNNTTELTSRKTNSEVTSSLKELEVKYTLSQNQAVDVCLATNMIATGLDVSRLGLMFIHGQPKTTAEYIQASSRVGRDDKGPGLVIMLYSPSKPRDKSIYERFQSYHSRIYSFVEPSSVTPFSANARKRALHAVVIGLMRHFASGDLRANAYLNPENSEHIHLKTWVTKLILERVEKVDKEEKDYTKENVDFIFRTWFNTFTKYGDARNYGITMRAERPLMYVPAADVPPYIVSESFATPTTMRGVDESVSVSIANPERLRMLRAGQIVSPFGIGQMINFPGNESLMVGSLEAWDQVVRQRQNQGAKIDIEQYKIVDEPRLQSLLDVKYFRRPFPFTSKQEAVNSLLTIPSVRFPKWHYCSVCGRMEDLPLMEERTSECKRCKGKLIPVRFVAACSAGHMQDVPFQEWVHRRSYYDESHILEFRAGHGAGDLKSIRIICTKCDADRSLAGITRKGALSTLSKTDEHDSIPNDYCEDKQVMGYKCKGHRPWLGKDGITFPQTCDQDLQVLIKGGSNVHYTLLKSAIHLPHYGNELDPQIISYFKKDERVLSQLYKTNQSILRTILDGSPPVTKGYIKPEVLYDEIVKLIDPPKEPEIAIVTEESIRQDEYRFLLEGRTSENSEFKAIVKNSDEYQDSLTNRLFKRIVLVEKLRETRVFAGFTRIEPISGPLDIAKRNQLLMFEAGAKAEWLPAQIVFGEGIFLEFSNSEIEKWQAESVVSTSAESVIVRYHRAMNRRFTNYNPRNLNATFIMMHTFAHLLINRLCFNCGYGSSSLRERIYFNAGPEKQMNGILIYTSSGDSEGSLGGLVRQGKNNYLVNLIHESVEDARWCSSDPVCSDIGRKAGQGPDSVNGAACHCCAIVPETSCEEFNMLLDRSLVIDSPFEKGTGYFS